MPDADTGLIRILQSLAIFHRIVWNTRSSRQATRRLGIRAHW